VRKILVYDSARACCHASVERQNHDGGGARFKPETPDVVRSITAYSRRTWLSAGARNPFQSVLPAV
jgi:hypothetical protein